ncbi:primosomal protein N' [Nocardia sp. NPDC051321]|uniref:primosomal protein N' n=1 Tax=Nocardia sp. NPDC051321 TaxID=3364323 RepID=UPI0037AEA7A1
MNKPAADTPAIPGVPPAGPAAVEHPIARVLPLLSPAHLDRDFDYLVPPELDAIAQPGVRVRVRFAGRLVDGYLLERRAHSDHSGKLVKLERVVSAERVLTPEIVQLATAVAARYAGTRADVLRLAIPPRHARTEVGGAKKKSADSEAEQDDSAAKAPLRVNFMPDATSPVDSADAEADSVTQAAPIDASSSTAASDAAGSAGSPPVRPAPSGANVPMRSAKSSKSVPSTTDYAGAEADSIEVDGTVEATAELASGSAATQEDPRRQSGGVASSEPLPAAPSDGDPAGVESDSAMRSRAVDESSATDTADAASSAAAQGDPSEPSDEPGSEEGGGESGSDGAEQAAAPVDHGPWGRYIHGPAFLTALAGGKGPRAAWQALPGEDWPRRLAELAAAVAAEGRSAILMVPDQRDLDRVLAECTRLMGDSAVGLSAGLGPAARYRRWLAVLRGTARVVVGTRSAVFAPAKDLGLIAIWDDGDDTYAEPRSPYPHAREVAMLRSHETGAAFVAAGFARTAEIQAVVESGWAHDLVADRMVVRDAAPRISVPGDTDIAMERDPVARAVRIPGVAYAAARAALKEGAGVLVQVPRRGYVPSLACAKCRTPARCRHCNGPLALPDGRARHSDSQGDAAHSPSCRWCGITEAAFRCSSCGSRALRAVVIGATRTAEELGRAFPGVPIRGSGGGAMLDTVEPGPQVVVATVGAEPVLPGGYGVALLLDSWALLSRADLRASEDALRRWMTAATLVRSHGQVIVMADPGIPTVQALVRWDPVGHARVECASRAEVGFPPAVRMAAVDGTSDSIAELLSATDLPTEVEVLGPVPLPPGARKPFSSGDTPAEVERILLRVDRKSGAALARALTAAQAIRSTHRSDAPLRVQIDPVDIG